MARFTKDTKLKEILNDADACEVLKKHYPVDLNNPLMGLAHGMTLEECFNFPQVEFTEEQKQQVYDELAALG